MEREEYLAEERRINENKNKSEALLRDVIRETERDMKATLREVEAKYNRQIAEGYKVERNLLKEKKTRAKMKEEKIRQSRW